MAFFGETSIPSCDEDNLLAPGTNSAYGTIPQQTSPRGAESSFLANKTQWTYIKEYILLIWPFNDRRTLGWVVVRILHAIRDRVTKVVIPLLLGSITDDLAIMKADVKPSRTWIYLKCLLFVLLRWTSNFGLFDGISANRIDSHIQNTLAHRGQSCVMEQPADYHYDTHPDELGKAIEQGSESSFLLDEFGLTTIPLLVDFVVISILISYNVWIVVNIIILVVMYTLISIKASFWLSDPRRIEVELALKESQSLRESLRYWQTVHLFQLQKHQSDQYTHYRSQRLSAHQTFHYRFYLVQALYTVLDNLTLFSILLQVIYEIFADRLSPGKFSALYILWISLINPLAKLSNVGPRLSAQLAETAKLLDIIARKPTPDVHAGKLVPPKPGRIAFDEVSFKYKDTETLALNRISFTVEPGQVVAIVGKSGSGKTTLTRLLLRMFEPSSGCITLDGVDLREYSVESVQKQVSLLHQTPELFSCSVMDNVKVAKLDASDKEVREACEKAGIPEDLLGRSGENGLHVSGGEAQRIAIARMHLRKAPVLVLDEPTSAVDSITEAKILQELEGLAVGRTKFIVAHRLSTIKKADLILVLEDGAIAEMGRHEELVSRRGAYFESWRLQSIGRSCGACTADAPLEPGPKGHHIVQESLAEHENRGF